MFSFCYKALSAVI